MKYDERIRKKFEDLCKEGKQILEECHWDGQDYHHYPDDVDYRRFRTEAMNLSRKICGRDSDHYLELKRIADDKATAFNSYFMKDCVGIVEAARKDYEGGYLEDLRTLVRGEVLEDFLGQATALLEEGYVAAAASLAGAVLEDCLRKLCQKSGLTIPERTTIDKLNTDLYKAEVYSLTVHKRITSIADIRNNSSHGHFTKILRDDVVDMITYIHRFRSDYLE